MFRELNLFPSNISNMVATVSAHNLRAADEKVTAKHSGSVNIVFREARPSSDSIFLFLGSPPVDPLLPIGMLRLAP
jgi:hypothetical protein